jgi:hypothetical protein
VADNALASQLLRAGSFEQANDTLDAACPPPRQLHNLLDLLSGPRHGEVGKQVREPSLTSLLGCVGTTVWWW